MPDVHEEPAAVRPGRRRGALGDAEGDDVRQPSGPVEHVDGRRVCGQLLQ